MSFDAETSLRLIAESLSLVDRLGADPIDLKNVRITDRTLVVEIVATSADPIAVRAEIAGVMGALSGLDVPSLFPVLGIQSFGVRAFNAANAELLWIVSSLDAAAFAAKGQPIEWLSRSWMQENTPAYRRSQADRMIGQVETALRDLSDFHARNHAGEEYLDHLWPANVVGDLRDRAQTEGLEIDDPRALLDFTYLPQLLEAIITHVAWMDDGCVPEGSALNRALTTMNRVRRKVAHHRPISEEDLRACRETAQSVLGPVGQVHPELATDFLVDRWEEEIAEIFATAMQTLQSPTVPDAGSVSERERRAAAVAALDTQLSGLESALNRMKQVVVPAQRTELHRRALTALVRWRDGLRQLATVGKRPNARLADLEARQAEYENALREVGELRREIKALRVGMQQAPREGATSSGDDTHSG